jgi:hypothetical protein
MCHRRSGFERIELPDFRPAYGIAGRLPDQRKQNGFPWRRFRLAKTMLCALDDLRIERLAAQAGRQCA